MKTKGRTLRVGALIKEEIAKLIMKGLKDPRIGFVSVMDVRMSKDLRYANVYVSLLGSESERKSSLVGLQHSAGWIRREVARYLHMRVLPEIRFFPDDTLDKVYHLEEVLEEIHAEQHRQPMLALTPEEAIDTLRKTPRCYVVSHQNPDGDAIGSMLALRLLLQQIGVTEITCALEDAVPLTYRQLPGAAAIVNADTEPPEYDAAILVDCGCIDRVGEVADHIPDGKRILIFDHHAESGEPGASGIIDTRYAATGEVIAELYKAAQVAFDKESALCLYTSVATDTGCFRFANTTPNSHVLAAELMAAGIDVGALNKRLFSDMTRAKFDLMRLVLSRVEFYAEGAIALSWLTGEDLNGIGARMEDAENLINLWFAVDSVRIAVLLKTFEEDMTRVSFRSDATFDSAAFLRGFGGGGHARAAGATLEMPLEEARGLLLSALLNHEGVVKIT